MKRISKRQALLSGALLLAVLSVTLAAVPHRTAETDSDVFRQVPAIHCKYIVREHNGLVAVFLPDAQLPSHVTDTPVSALPQADRLQLQEGITIATEEALTAILEDYGS